MLLVCTAQAKDGYKIKLSITNCDDSVAYLCYYYGKQTSVYKADSVRIKPSAKVAVAFESDKKIQGGIYIILFSDRATRVEVLLNNGDDFEVSFDKKDAINTTKFMGSKENTNFIEYQNFAAEIGKKYEALQDQMEKCKTAADSNKLTPKYQELTENMSKYRADFRKNNPGTLAAALFGAMAEPSVPEGKKYLKDGKTVDSLFKPRYYKEHYWDDFNFQDNRLVYSPIYDNKLNQYFRSVFPVPDSLNKECDMLLGKSKGAPDVFKYTLWWLTRFVDNSKVMGVDESFVYLVENYYMKGDAFWMADSNVQKYVEEAKKIAPNMIGQKAPDIRIPNIEGTVQPLSSVYPAHDYTLLTFWSADCGHCKKEIPQLDSIVKKYKSADIAIYGVHSENDDEKWRKFIAEKKLGGSWIHLHDPMRVGNWRSMYNISATPVMYLINKEGEIVGKKIDHTNLEGLLDFLQRKKASKGEQK
jgi:thiol-disulfide isomerase/thioredoxin